MDLAELVEFQLQFNLLELTSAWERAVLRLAGCRVEEAAPGTTPARRNANVQFKCQSLHRLDGCAHAMQPFHSSFLRVRSMTQ